MTSQTFNIFAIVAGSVAMLALHDAAAQSSSPRPAEPAPAAPANESAAPSGPTRAGQTMYRWVDKDKRVHYSDRPQPGADSVPVQSPQTYSAPKAPAPAPTRSSTSAAPPAAVCGITSPTADQTFPNAQSVMISYRGPSGGQAELLLNGAAKQTLAAGQAFTLSPVPRGTYSAVVVINSDTGTTLCRTPAVTFHVTQPSLLSPVRQQMNRPPPPRPPPRAN